MIDIFRVFFVGLALLLVGGPARANPTQHDIEICVEIDIAFDGNNGGDVWTSNSVHRRARGVLLDVREYDQHGAYVRTVWSDYVEVSGCKTLALWNIYTYAIKSDMKAEVNGVPIAVYETGTDTNPSWTVFYSSLTGYQPTAPTTLTLVVPTSYKSANLAVGILAMYQNNAGLSWSTPLEYDVYDYNPEVFNGTKYARIRARTYHKWIIAHETGHRVVRLRDGDLLPDEDQGSNTDNCDGEGTGNTGHTTTTKEWFSTAIKEGFGDFYAAAMWNDHTSDCDYVRHYETDFDLDGIDDTFEGLMSCEGVPVSFLETYVTNRDWLEDLIAANDPLGCSGDLTHKSTQYDMLRYFWDLLTDGTGVPLEDIIETYDESDPHDWNPQHNIITPSNDPEARWYTKIINNGYMDEHDDAASNGMDH